MTSQMHPAALHHQPSFITAPGETDVLMMVMLFFLIGTVIALGAFYFRLHALPEHIAHKGQKVQMEIVAVLALISLFTHNHLFWILGLLLAMVQLPDFSTPTTAVVNSLSRIADAQEERARASIRAPAQPAAARKKQPKSPDSDKGSIGRPEGGDA
ncbi:MAG: hypothetical protein AB7U38_10285 [Hyphomicrobiales bacterium]